MVEQVQKVGVIGSGTMGNGIAQVSAMAGCAVTLVDIDDARLQTAKANIQNKYFSHLFFLYGLCPFFSSILL